MDIAEEPLLLGFQRIAPDQHQHGKERGRDLTSVAIDSVIAAKLIG